MAKDPRRPVTMEEIRQILKKKASWSSMLNRFRCQECGCLIPERGRRCRKCGSYDIDQA